MSEQTNDEQTVDTVAESTVDSVPESTIDESTVDTIAESTVPETVNVAAADEQTVDEQTVDATQEVVNVEAVPESTVWESEETVAENVITEYKPEETTNVLTPPSVVITTTLVSTIATAGAFTTVFEVESADNNLFSLSFDQNGTTLIATNHLTGEQTSYDMSAELQNSQAHEVGMNISEDGMSIIVDGSEVSSLEFAESVEIPNDLTITEAPNLSEDGVTISGLDTEINDAVMGDSEDESFALLQDDFALDLDLATGEENENQETNPESSESELNLNDMVSNSEAEQIDLSNVVSSTPEETTQNSQESTPTDSSSGNDIDSPFDVINSSGQNDELANLLNNITPDTDAM